MTAKCRRLVAAPYTYNIERKLSMLLLGVSLHSGNVPVAGSRWGLEESRAGPVHLVLVTCVLVDLMPRELWARLFKLLSD